MASHTTTPDGITAGQTPGDTSDDGIHVVRAQTYADGSTGFGWYRLGGTISTPSGGTFNPGPLEARVQTLETGKASVTGLTTVATDVASVTTRVTEVEKRGGTLFVFRDAAARNAVTPFLNMYAATLTNSWTKWDGNAWVSRTKALVLSRVIAAVGEPTDAEVQPLLSGGAKAINYDQRGAPITP